MVTAASIGFLHTILGPDHYIPFIMMARARRWTTIKTAWITFLCGLGHVGSSIVFGVIGIVFGLSVNKLIDIEAFRGNIAAWLFMIFGLGYLVWGIVRAVKNKQHVPDPAAHDGMIINDHYSDGSLFTHVHSVHLTPARRQLLRFLHRYDLLYPF